MEAASGMLFPIATLTSKMYRLERDGDLKPAVRASKSRDVQYKDGHNTPPLLSRSVQA